jgi:hypothetical protein
LVEGGYDGIKAKPDLKGIPITVTSVTPTLTTVLSDTTLEWVFSPNTAIDSTAYIELYLPDGFAFLPTT